MASVSDADRRHFAAIAEGMARVNREEVEACGRRSPAENIRRGLALSAFGMAVAPNHDKPLPPSISRLWADRRGPNGVR